MDYNKDKVDECTLALLTLVMHEKNEHGARAWKSFDWDTMTRLHKKGYISNPVGKAKSVMVTTDGIKKAEGLFKKYFGVEKWIVPITLRVRNAGHRIAWTQLLASSSHSSHGRHSPI